MKADIGGCEFLPDKGVVTVEARRDNKRLRRGQRINVPVEEAIAMARGGVPLDIIEADDEETKAIKKADRNKAIWPRVRGLFHRHK